MSKLIASGTLLRMLRSGFCGTRRVSVREGRATKIELLTSPAEGGSALPQLTLSDRGALLSWIERTATSPR